MKIEEALAIVDKVLADFRGSRADHLTIIEAFNLIKQEVDKAKEN